MSSFFTIKEEKEGIFKEKGSRFVSRCYPVEDENEIKTILSGLRKEFYDAGHHCYAWVLGFSDQCVRANDDGEPNHSAGDPILGQIRSFDLTNTLVVVVRYFGGIKLDVSGLINAYKTAAQLALEKTEKIQLFEMQKFRLKFSYDDLSHVERITERLDVQVIARNYMDSCELIGKIKLHLLDSLLKEIKPLYKIQVEYA